MPAAGDVAQARLRARELLAAAIELGQAGLPRAELEHLAQTAQGVEHEARERARLVARGAAVRSRPAGDEDGHRHAHERVARESERRQLRVDIAKEEAHDHGQARGDAHGAHRVGVEDLEQLDVGRHGRDEAAAVGPGELGGAELAQRAEHEIADVREQPEGDVMVAALLDVVEDAAGDGHEGEGGDGRGQSPCKRPLPRRRERGRGGEHGDARRAAEPGDAACHREDHPSGKRPREAEHAPHDAGVTPVHRRPPRHRGRAAPW